MYSLYTRARDRSSAAPSGRCIFSCLRDHSQSSVSFFTSSTCIFRFRIRLRFTARAHIVIVIETPARDRPTAHAYLSQARVISGARSAEDMHRAEIHRAREILPVPFPFLSPPGWQCSTQRCKERSETEIHERSVAKLQRAGSPIPPSPSVMRLVSVMLTSLVLAAAPRPATVHEVQPSSRDGVHAIWLNPQARAFPRCYSDVSRAPCRLWL